MALPKSTIERLRALQDPTSKVVSQIGVFIDTHRDLPHIGSFHDDLHRGLCRPIPVDAYVSSDRAWLRDPETGIDLMYHPKHLFVTVNWYQDFLVEQLMTNGTLPLDDKGRMPTKLLRDARSGVYVLKTFSYIINEYARTKGK